ncbi:hypothetical protein FB451DRAFT_428596 [Mycena latifolia]|nr:hypothetical protein FB451DRAFT_428596 [Mycena latifolia]
METISSALLLGQSGASSFEQQVKRLIEAAEANVAHIDSQIRDLMRLRDQERGVIAALKLVIAPIRKLPAELLVEIFMHAVESQYEWLKAVLAVCGVCAHWRQLACTTPRLWTGLLRIQKKKSASDGYLTMTKTLLDRSAPLPISISLNNDLAMEQPTPSLVDLFFSIAPRWRSLALDDVDSSLSKLRQLPPNALKSLEMVDLKTREVIHDYTPKVAVFLAAPRLRRVTLDVQRTDLIQIPWSQLTHLTLSENSPRMSLDILVQCPNIVVAKFLCLDAWVVPPTSAPIITLPRLNDLEVDFAVRRRPHRAFLLALSSPCAQNPELAHGSGPQLVVRRFHSIPTTIPKYPGPLVPMFVLIRRSHIYLRRGAEPGAAIYGTLHELR